MKSINYGTGYKTYALNGDENNVIKINVSDINILKRAKEVQSFIDSLGDIQPTPEKLTELDAVLREKIDYVFGSDVSEAAFGATNCFSLLDDGRFLFQAFLEALLPVIADDIKKSGAKISGNAQKYIKKSPKKPLSAVQKASDKIDLNNLTEEQKALLSAVLGANGV